MSKPYNTKSLGDRLNETVPEEGGQGKAGLYRHPESGQEQITLSDPLFGEAQSNAFVQLGFVRIRDARPGEVKTVLDLTLAATATETDSLKGLSARVAQMEGVNEENKDLRAQVEKYRKEALARADATNVSGHAAKTEAAENIRDRGQGDATKQVGPAPSTPPAEPLNSDHEVPEDSRVHVRDENRLDNADEEQDSEEEKPVQKQNETELKATAEAEGVDLSGAETVKAKREGILAAREGNKEESENE